MREGGRGSMGGMGRGGRFEVFGKGFERKGKAFLMELG